jgi:hypothetical protein
MACTQTTMVRFKSELADRKNNCGILLTEHEQATPDVIWQAADGEGSEPLTPGDKAKLKLVTEITFDSKNKIVFPPKFTRLSDELVYLATKFLPISERATNYPYDFNERGDIREERVPSGVSPVVWAHGLPFFPIFKGYYILCGREHARWVGWLLNNKANKEVAKAYPMWIVGPVVAPGSAVSLPRTVTRQAHIHVPTSAKDVDKRWEKLDTGRDVVCKAHHQPSIVPKFPSKGYLFSPIYRLLGYHVRCGPKAGGNKGFEIGRAAFSKHRIHDFDYDASLKKKYTNDENPAAYYCETSDESSELDSEATERMSGMDDGGDSSDDEWVASSDGKCDDNGDVGEEPPKKKAKKDHTYCDKGVQTDDGFSVDAAVSRLSSYIASLADERDTELSASLARSQIVNSVTETVAVPAAEHIEYAADRRRQDAAALSSRIEPEAVPTMEHIEYARDPRQDAATLTSRTETAVPTFEHIEYAEETTSSGNAGDPANETAAPDTEDTMMTVRGLVPPTNMASSGHNIGQPDTEAGADPAPTLPDTDFFED